MAGISDFFVLLVRAKDAGGLYSSNVTVNVSVIVTLNHAPVVTPATVSVYENSHSRTFVAKVGVALSLSLSREPYSSGTTTPLCTHSVSSAFAFAVVSVRR